MTDQKLERPDAEYGLLVRMILEPEVITDAVGVLDKDDFCIDQHGEVYGLIVSRFLDNKPTDSVIVKSETGWEFDPMSLPSGTHAPVGSYIESIKDASVRRSLVGVLDRARYRLTSTATDPFSVVEGAIEGIVQQHSSSSSSSAMVLDDYRSSYEERTKGGGGMTYGLEALDELLMPARPGRLIMLAARPSVGKTALAESIADHWAKSGPVLFASFEMQAEELMDRAMARDSGIPLEDIMRGRVSIDSLEEAISRRSNSNVFYMPPRNAGTSSAVRAEASRIKLIHGSLSGVIIDYIQLLADSDGGDNEVYRIGNISHSAKRMATSLGCPVLALVQFSRAIESSDTPRAPRLSDMRDSGILEQDADVVVALTGNIESEVRDLFVLKQRQGRIGRRTLWFDGSLQRWRSQQDDLTW